MSESDTNTGDRPRKLSLDAGTAVKYGIKRPFARDGLLVLGALWIVGIVGEIASQSLGGGFIQSGISQAIEAARTEAPPSAEGEIEAAGGVIADTLAPTLAVSIPAPAAAALWLVAWVLAVAVYVVGYRTFVRPGSDTIPENAYGEGLVRAMLHGFVAGILLRILVVVGLVFLVIPGIFIAVALALYLAYISLEDKGFVGGLKSSWGATRGNRFNLYLLGLGVITVFSGLWMLGGIAGFVVGAVSAVGAEVVSVGFSAYGSLIVVGSLAHAYLQLEGEELP